jgi:hypothetical protein
VFAGAAMAITGLYGTTTTVKVKDQLFPGSSVKVIKSGISVPGGHVLSRVKLKAVPVYPVARSSAEEVNAEGLPVMVVK